MRTIRQLVDDRAGADPRATFFIAPHTGRSLTFGELRDSCTAVSAMLKARGLVPGDHVSLVLGNGIQTVRLLLGAMYGGYCVNPVNLLSQPDQMRYVIDHADARIVFAALPTGSSACVDLVANISRPDGLHRKLMPDGDFASRRKREVASALGAAGCDQLRMRLHC